MVLQQEEVPIRNGYDVGIGVAMASGSPMALGAVGAVTPPQIGTGGSGSFVFRRIETTQELEDELGVGADVSAGIGLFSGSASFNFSKKCKIQSSSLTVLVSAVKRFAFQQMDSPSLSEPAAKLVERGKPLSEQFGEYFVRGISTGGRFFGVVRIDTKSVQSKTELNAALEGSYGVAVTAEVKTRIAQAMAQAEARAEAFILHDGGSITTHPRSGDPVELVKQLYQAMDEWSASVRQDAKAYTVTLAPYVIALGPTPPNLADIEKQRRVLIRCANLRSRAIDMLNLVEYILDFRHTNEFEIVPGGPDLPALQAALVSDLDIIEEAASFAIENLKEARDPEVFMRDIRGVPGFRLTTLPANMPKQKQAVLPTSITLTATNSPPHREVQFLDVPDSFQVTAKLTVNLPKPSDIIIRDAGLALFAPAGAKFSGVGKLVDEDGRHVCLFSGTLGVGSGYRPIDWVGNEPIYLKMTVARGQVSSIGLSNDGEEFSNVPEVMELEALEGASPTRKLALFATSGTDMSVTANFSELKIVPL
ncbi:hypothetical protein AB0A69_32720 [Streptomyces sp. NPDC045431]|uniref:hypothetical protein n=1 Tax=Streptomyces sp. NPDC045431 TaxID=3155613 RepID=UPI0033D2CF1A